MVCGYVYRLGIGIVLGTRPKKRHPEVPISLASDRLLGIAIVLGRSRRIPLVFHHCNSAAMLAYSCCTSA
jgi:hypothetical protein